MSVAVGSATGASFYERPGVFAFRPNEKRAGQTICRFGPAGIDIELTLPAFGMKIKDVETAYRLADDLLEAQKEYLPQF